MEHEQEKALKLMVQDPHKTHTLVDIELATGCDGLAMGDLLHKGYVIPTKGITHWKITMAGTRAVRSHLDG